MPSEISQSHKRKVAEFHSEEILKSSEIDKSRTGVATGPSGRGIGELLFNRHRVSLLQDEERWEMGRGNGRKTMSMFLMPLNSLTNRENGTFCYVCFITD